jgi:hypothetical protein
MICYRDRSYCASSACTNKCGRKITDTEREEAIKTDMPIAWGYFCEEQIIRDGLPVMKDGEGLYLSEDGVKIGRFYK